MTRNKKPKIETLKSTTFKILMLRSRIRAVQFLIRNRIQKIIDMTDELSQLEKSRKIIKRQKKVK